MTVVIIESFEVIEVDDYHRQRSAGAGAATPFRDERFIKMTPIGQSGQTVDPRELAQQIGLTFQSDQGADPGAHDFCAGGFDDEIDRSGGEAVLFFGGIALRRDEDHRNLPSSRIKLQPAAYFVAVES